MCNKAVCEASCLPDRLKVRNLRSGVSRVAVVALGDMFVALQKGMDQELDGATRALLHKAGESNAFIRQDVERALDSMVQHCTVTRSMSALLAGGLGSAHASSSLHASFCCASETLKRLCVFPQSPELGRAQVRGSASVRSGGEGRRRPPAVRDQRSHRPHSARRLQAGAGLVSGGQVSHATGQRSLALSAQHSSLCLFQVLWSTDAAVFVLSP